MAGPDIDPAPQNDRSRPLLRRAALATLLTAGAIGSLFLGAGSLDPVALIRGDQQALRLLLLSRIPRLLTIAIVGSGLAVSGLILQAVLRNRFASPSTAASVDGAKLGFVLALLLAPGASAPLRAGLAFLGALGAGTLYVAILERLRFGSVIVVPLTGLVLGSLIDAVADAIAFRFDLVQSTNSWLLGNFALIVAGRYELLFVAVPILAVAYAFASRFAVAGLGRDMAVNLGLNYRATIVLALLVVAAVSSLSVVVVGRLPFVGLVVPNLVALTRGERADRSVLPTALAGATFVLSADVIGRVVIHPFEIPIGLSVAVCGSAIFLLFLARVGRRGA